jgi:hypothetical protein
MLAIKRQIIGYRMDTSTDLAVIVLLGYMLCFPVLVLGAAIQRRIAPRKAFLWTCGFIAGLFLFAWLTFPYLAHT